MTSDSRESVKVESEVVLIGSGSSSATDIIELKLEDTLSPEYIKLAYGNGSSTTVTVELYDEPAGTTSGSLNDLRETLVVPAGETRIIDDVALQDFENGVVALPDGNQDADFALTVGGYKVTG